MRKADDRLLKWKADNCVLAFLLFTHGELARDRNQRPEVAARKTASIRNERFGASLLTFRLSTFVSLCRRTAPPFFDCLVRASLSTFGISRL